MTVASKEMPQCVGQVLDVDGNMLLVEWSNGIKQWCHTAFLRLI